MSTQCHRNFGRLDFVTDLICGFVHFTFSLIADARFAQMTLRTGRTLIYLLVESSEYLIRVEPIQSLNGGAVGVHPGRSVVIDLISRFPGLAANEASAIPLGYDGHLRFLR